QPFDSKGQRCCSIKCEHVYRLKQELADQPFRATKRKCAECGYDIPSWRKGRRGSKATPFCSDPCSAKTGPKSGRLPHGRTPHFVARNAKKVPVLCGSAERSQRPDRSVKKAQLGAAAKYDEANTDFTGGQSGLFNRRKRDNDPLKVATCPPKRLLDQVRRV